MIREGGEVKNERRKRKSKGEKHRLERGSSGL